MRFEPGFRTSSVNPTTWMGALAALLLLSGSTPTQSAVATDDCSSAPALVMFYAQHGFSSSGNLTNATIDGACSCAPASPDMWLKFTPTIDGGFRAYTALTQVTDWVISVHTGCPGTAANEIACNDDSPYVPGGGARVELNLTAGQTYWIRVAGSHGSQGQFNLYADFPTDTWPPNDDPSRAVHIAPGAHHGDSTGADEFDPEVCIGWRAIWYQYVPVQSGLVNVNTCAQPSGPHALDDTYISVYDGSSYVGCVDDTCMYNAALSFNALAGHEYRVRVGDWWGVGGEFVLTLTGPPAAGNACSALPDLVEGQQMLSLVGALANGASACDAGTEDDMAFAFAAPSDGTLTVTTCGTHDGPGVDVGEDTLVSIHSGCPPTAANTIVCNDTAVPPCTGDVGGTGDAWVETVMTAGQRVVVRITRAGPQSSDQPILLTATFRPGMVLCAGDGSGTACPCGNTGALGHGCAHSSGAGALLQASGVASVSADTLRLEGSGLPLTAPGMYVQGTSLVAGGSGAVFGDGLRCVAGAVIRLGVRSSTNGASAYGEGDGTNASVAQKGLVPASGGTRHYQLWFRDAAPFCTSAAFNLSNSLSILWTP